MPLYYLTVVCPDPTTNPSPPSPSCGIGSSNPQSGRGAPSQTPRGALGARGRTGPRVTLFRWLIPGAPPKGLLRKEGRGTQRRTGAPLRNIFIYILIYRLNSLGAPSPGKPFIEVPARYSPAHNGRGISLGYYFYLFTPRGATPLGGDS